MLRDPKGHPVSGKQLWSNGYLPALFQGVEFSSSGVPVYNLAPAEPFPPGAQAASLEYLQQLNRKLQREHAGESELEARIQNHELAARMQLAATEVLDLFGNQRHYGQLFSTGQPRDSKICLPGQTAAAKFARTVGHSPAEPACIQSPIPSQFGPPIYARPKTNADANLPPAAIPEFTISSSKLLHKMSTAGARNFLNHSYRDPIALAGTSDTIARTGRTYFVSVVWRGIE